MKTLRVAVAALALAGCSVRDGSGGIEAAIAPGHIHTVDCGHYRRGEAWYFRKGHVHGPGCGHVFVDGVWTAKNS